MLLCGALWLGPAAASADIILINNGIFSLLPVEGEESQNDELIVEDRVPGEPTNVEVFSLDGHFLGTGVVRGSSSIHMSGNQHAVELLTLEDHASLYHDATGTPGAGGGVTLRDSSSATIADSGSFTFLNAFDESTLAFSGGVDDLFADEDTQVKFDGFVDTLSVLGVSFLRGGSASDSVTLGGLSRITGGSFSPTSLFDLPGDVSIRGGSIGAFPGTPMTVGGRTTVLGSNFAIDGVSVPVGQVIQTSGVLTGELASGGSIHVEYLVLGGATLILAPEPRLLMTFGLGLLAVAIRLRSRS